MRRLAVPSVLLLVTGCSGAAAKVRPEARAATAAPEVARPVVARVLGRGEVDLPDGVPLSIKRLVSEQRVEIDDIRALVTPIEDVRGRARATRDLDGLAAELGEVESDLKAATADSERYDALVVKLQKLSTRTSLMHEALRGALATTAVELDPAR